MAHAATRHIFRQQTHSLHSPKTPAVGTPKSLSNPSLWLLCFVHVPRIFCVVLGATMLPPIPADVLTCDSFSCSSALRVPACHGPHVRCMGSGLGSRGVLGCVGLGLMGVLVHGLLLGSHAGGRESFSEGRVPVKSRSPSPDCILAIVCA